MLARAVRPEDRVLDIGFGFRIAGEFSAKCFVMFSEVDRFPDEAWSGVGGT